MPESRNRNNNTHPQEEEEEEAEQQEREERERKNAESQSKRYIGLARGEEGFEGVVEIGVKRGGGGDSAVKKLKTIPTAEGFKDTPNWQWMSCKRCSRRCLLEWILE